MVGRQNADIAHTLQLKVKGRCMIASDEDIADFEVLRDVAIVTVFGFLYMGYTLTNTTKPSQCCGDAALCQITLTTCYLFESDHIRVHKHTKTNKIHANKKTRTHTHHSKIAKYTDTQRMITCNSLLEQDTSLLTNVDFALCCS